MEGLRPPDVLVLDENRSEKWTKWIKAFELYMKAARRSQDADDVIIAVLLTSIGQEGQDIYHTLEFAEAGDDAETYKNVKKKFSENCEPVSNETFDRYKFRSRVQDKGEDFDQFYSALKQLVEKCSYETPRNNETIRNSVIRDQIVIGIQDANLRERLLRESKLTLDKAV